ncbi:hypothetical protein BOX15_Mlig007113g2 [Macrostomum lignano]|uniref:Oxysterol-binding protein n=1 Tax=Macrostomum lignano TaxID=282301 RepID=A0A267GH48_9PLAT|nr:hypothetical protein BOX15_Mlig007113g2 [Macrostomum lignano]
MDDDFDKTIADIHNLTPYERQKLRSIMQRKKQFDMEESAHLRQTVEGALLKFTNVVKGFQPRWFVLNAETGALEYYEKEEYKRQGQRSRGELQLTFATVVPSEDDSCTFSVNSTSGEVFRVKATDARERQYWVDRIRAVAQYYSEQCKILGSYNPVSLPEIYSCTGRSSSAGSASSSAGAGFIPSVAAAAAASTSSAAVASSDAPLPHHQALPPPKRPRQRDQPTSLSDDNGSRGGRVAYPSPDGLLASLRDAITILDDLVTNLPPPPCTAAVEQSGGSVGAFSNEGSLYSGCASQADAGDQPDDSAEVLVDADGEGEGEEAYNVANEEAIDADGSLEVGEDAAASAVSDQEVTESCGGGDGGMESTATPTASTAVGLPSCLDRDLLTARGTAAGALRSLEACLDLLPYVRSQAAASASSVSLAPARIAPASTAGLSGTATPAALSAGLHSAAVPVCVGDSLSFAAIVPLVEMLENPAFPVPHQLDEPDQPEPDASDASDQSGDASQEEHKSVVLHLLQQLKLGMDLTRVVLPTFILERRSLLEMFADFMLHPDCLLRAAEQPDAESRITGVLEWYLTGFHGGRRGAAAKKPYNPLIGETFHCSWQIPSDSGENSDCLLTYTAEQVSHHPPITAFYMECPQKQVWLNASIYTKSKFMGMSIGVNMIGRLQLHLMQHDEVYNITLPSAYARSILTVPWVELGDKVTISCDKTKYNASVIFHTKPFYGGRLHRVSAEVRNPASSVVCRVSGEWSGQLEFDYPDWPSQRRLIDVSLLTAAKKRVRPLSQQRAYESRRLWAAVTEALRANDIQRATEEKRKLEERQRHCERLRRERGIQFPVKYFVKDDEDNWTFKRPLQKGQLQQAFA